MLNSKYLVIFRHLFAPGFLNWFSKSIPFWSENKFCIISVLLNVLRLFYGQTDFFVYVWIFHLHSRGLLELPLQVREQAAGAWRTLCTCCTEVGGWVSRMGGVDVQWEVFGTSAEQNCKSSIFLSIINWTYGYQ